MSDKELEAKIITNKLQELRQIVQLRLQIVAHVLQNPGAAGANRLIHAYLETRMDQLRVFARVQTGHIIHSSARLQQVELVAVRKTTAHHALVEAAASGA